jgi:DNA repair exonuclease SbcCD ATPase subunit
LVLTNADLFFYKEEEMANKKITYQLEIDAEIDSLQKKLNTAKNLMANVLNSGQAPKGLEKSFEKIEDLIDKIRAKASQPIDSKGGFTSIDKDIGSINIALASLLGALKKVGSASDATKLNFLPPEIKAQIETIIAGLESYEKAMEAATAETAELTQARKNLAKAEQEV